MENVALEVQSTFSMEIQDAFNKDSSERPYDLSDWFQVKAFQRFGQGAACLGPHAVSG